MALFEHPVILTDPTYTVQQLNQAFEHLEELGENFTLIFETYGAAIELSKCVRDFTKVVERRALALVTDDWEILESVWRDTLYANFLTAFPSSRFADMFNTLTQNQFNVILTRIIYWNPLPYNETRDFDAYVNGMVPGASRSLQAPKDTGVTDDIKTPKKTRKTNKKSRKQVKI